MLSASLFDRAAQRIVFRGGAFPLCAGGGAILFTIFAAFYYWFPKMSGRVMNETLGRW